MIDLHAKKMKQMTAILFGLSACISSFGQQAGDVRASISADVTSIIMAREVRLGASHSFSEHWSAEGNAAVQIPILHKSRPDEDEHDQLLSEGEEKTVREKRHPEFRMGIRFWPRKYMDGPFMAIHCSHNMKSGTDIVLEGGYAVRIWKCIGVAAGYEIKLIDSITNDRFGTEGITIGINYTF